MLRAIPTYNRMIFFKHSENDRIKFSYAQNVCITFFLNTDKSVLKIAFRIQKFSVNVPIQIKVYTYQIYWKFMNINVTGAFKIRSLEFHF